MDASSFDWLAFSGVKQDSNTSNANPNTISNVFSNLSINSTNGKSASATDITTERKLPSNNPSSISLDATNITTETNIVNVGDPSVPLSLSIKQLSPEESKTYIRWYNDISIRKHSKLIKITDVLDFLKNFNLSESLKNYLKGLFNTNLALNVGQFFALLRLISHYIHNLTVLRKDSLPPRNAVLQVCQVPKPRSILSKKRITDDNEADSGDEGLQSPLSSQAVANPFAVMNGNGKSDSKIDLDSFAKFIMTGEKPLAGKNSQSPIKKGKKKKKAKRVKFSDQLVTVAASAASVEDPAVGGQQYGVDTVNDSNQSQSDNLDLSLPMDQLLKRLQNNPTKKHQIPVRKISEQEVKDEEDILGENFKHFQNVNIESALVGGKAAAIPQELVPTNTGGMMENDTSSNFGYQQQPQPQMLQPTLTGSANYFLKKNQAPIINESTSNYFTSQNIMGTSLSPSGNFSPNGLSPNNTNTGAANMLTPLNSVRNGSLSPSFLSPQPSGLQANTTGPNMFQPQQTIQATQQPQYQPNMLSPLSTSNNNLRAGSLSPQPTASAGEDFINSLTGRSPPPPPPRSRSSSINATLLSSNNNFNNSALHNNITNQSADLAALNSFPPPPSSRNRTESVSRPPPALPPKINLSSSDLNLPQQQSQQQLFQPTGFGQQPQQMQQTQQTQQQFPYQPQFSAVGGQQSSQFNYSNNNNTVQGTFTQHGGAQSFATPGALYGTGPYNGNNMMVNLQQPQQQVYGGGFLQQQQQRQDDLEWFERD